jgi:hypothetical protein
MQEIDKHLKRHMRIIAYPERFYCVFAFLGLIPLLLVLHQIHQVVVEIAQVKF